ncbi:PhzF family phenazine biosynthesis protein [Flindersiella endophytica]
MSYDFTLIDVFSERPFGGNQLAVFPDATGIDEPTMQRLAREFNFSETTFVLPPSDPGTYTHRVRIFTPQQELPFAGHPTIGTAAVLTQLTTQQRFVFEEGIGPVRVEADGPAIRLCLEEPACELAAETPPDSAIAKALGLPADAIAESWYAGVGFRFCLVRLHSKELVDRATLDKTAWEAGVADCWSPHLYVYAGAQNDVHARFFAPAFGIDEDPATGSGCATLLASRAGRAPEPDGTYTVRITQGVAMGRPSVLEGAATKRNERVTEVVVGGRTAILGSGSLRLPWPRG